MTAFVPGKIGPYIIRKQIGMGAFSHVYLVNNHEGMNFSCKVISKKLLEQNHKILNFEREVMILFKLKHDNIARLIDILQDSLNYYIFSELCEIDLEIYIQKFGKFDEEYAKKLFFQIVEGINYMHELNIAHRDLKPSNILLFNQYNSIKITDFGFSREIIYNSLSETMCGTLSFASPEIIKCENYDPIKSDIWSLGIILYVMVFGRLPWIFKNISSLIEQINNCLLFFPPNSSPILSNLILSMMKIDPNERFSCKDILNHEWLKGFQLSNISQIYQSKINLERIQTLLSFDNNISLNILPKISKKNSKKIINYSPKNNKIGFYNLSRMLFTNK